MFLKPVFNMLFYLNQGINNFYTLKLQ